MARSRRVAGRRRLAQAAVASGIGVAVVGLVGTGVAFADNGSAAELSITASATTSSLKPAPGACNVRLTSDLTVVNLSDTILKYQSIHPYVSWQAGSASGVLGPKKIAIVYTGTPPLQAGDTLAAHATQSYDGIVTTFTIRHHLCSAITNGDLAIHVLDQFGTGSGDETFVANGVFSPIDAAGGLGLAALLGGGLAMTYRRWRRPSRAGGQAVASGKA
jgi:hypothetical protein